MVVAKSALFNVFPAVSRQRANSDDLACVGIQNILHTFARLRYGAGAKHTLVPRKPTNRSDGNIAKCNKFS